tara:strand:- start:3389 stop:3562 length:174 start_codon:yes stop_codon:yes gene_type:complete
MKEQINNDKKALWVSADLHKELKVFAVLNNMSIESASQLLLKLGVCSHELEKQNGSE